MEDLKQFKKLPAASQKILTDYAEDKNKDKLFEEINDNIDTQISISSRAVRRSIFRGLLRKHFKMSDRAMRSIDSTTAEKQEYHEKLQAGVNSQHVDVINKDLLQKLLKSSPIMFLLITSGLRIQELLSSEARFDTEKTEVHFKLTKKKKTKFYNIETIINEWKWYQMYEIMKIGIAEKVKASVIGVLNRQLKKIIPDTFYKRSSHISRAIYVKYNVEYNNALRQPAPMVIRRLLHHENFEGSAHYQYIKLDRDIDDFIR